MIEALSPEAVLARYGNAVLSHESAARKLDIELLGDDGTQRITVPRSHGRVKVSGWRVCRADLAGSDMLESRTTACMRTVLDLGRVLPLTEAVAAADSALRKGLVQVSELMPALAAARGNGSAQLRELAPLLDPRSGSVLESALRVTLVTSGIPAPCTQFWVQDGAELFARVDFCWPAQRLIVEADGYAYHRDRDAYRRDRERLNRLERLGWRVLRFTWEDVMSRSAYVVGSVRACLAQAA